jgi:hypothetical protein
MTAIRTLLVDEVPYASPADVLTYVRNRDSFETDANGGDPPVEEVHSLLLDRSEFADNRTNRAWRTRKVENYSTDIKLSHTQKSPRHRRRQRTSSASGRRKLRDPSRQPEPFAEAQLPHLNVRVTDPAKGLDSNEGDLLEVRVGRSKNEITDDPGIENGAYYLKESRGRVMIDLAEITITGVSSYGRLISENADLLVTYRYGTDESTAASGYDTTANETDTSTSTYARTENTPEDVRRAVAKLVAADLFQTDQYGNILPATGEEASPDEAATDLRSEAMDTLNEHRRMPGA